MAYHTSHVSNEVVVCAHSNSIGASAEAAYARAPVQGYLTEVAVTAHGVITSADCDVAIAINGNSVTASLSLPVSGAAAGQTASAVSSGSNKYVVEGDVISFTPSGASGSSIPATFQARIR